MADAGVPAEGVLRVATTASAEAIDAERDFGRIRPGMRADFVRLELAGSMGATKRPRGSEATRRPPSQPKRSCEGFIPSAEALEAMAATNESGAGAEFVR